MFWFVNTLVNDPTTLNHTGSFRIRGKLRVADLTRAVEDVGFSHESLRTCFYHDSHESQLPTQGVLPTGTLHLEVSHIANEKEVVEKFSALHQHVYDLEHGQVMRIMLLTKSPDEHYLLIGAHHINVDGFTHQVLMQDLEKSYNNQPLSKPLQYLDYSIRQREEFLNGSWEEDLRYWTEGLQTIPDALPVLPLPDARPRKILDSYDFHRHKFRLNDSLYARINKSSRSMKVTPFHFYLSSFRALIYLLSGTRDFSIGIGDANRTSPEMLSGIGAFVNILPLVFTHSERATFADILQDTREKVLGALSHSRVPFGAMLDSLSVARSEYHSPIFQTFLDYREGVKETTMFANTQMEMLNFESGRTAYDINVDITNCTTGCQVEFMVQTSIYSENDLKFLVDAYQRVLESFSETPMQPLTTLNVYGDEKVLDALQLGRGKFKTPCVCTYLSQYLTSS
jgi:hybrid polyketide synthase / nonribosomal peptide synthetase ACE1